MAKPKQTSITLRLAIGLSLGTAILWLGAALIAALVMQHELNETLDDRLKRSARLILPLAVYSHSQSLINNAKPLTISAAAAVPHIILDAQKHLVIFSDHPRGIKTPKLNITLGFSNLRGRRTYGYVDIKSGYSIQVFESITDRNELLFESIMALIWPLTALIPLIGLGIWFGVKLALKPLDRLRADIAKRDGRNLTPLTSHNHPKELAPIADEVAELLTRLDSALKAERSFAASSAHELRTPIAGALAQTQRLAIELGQNTGHKRLKEIETSLKHLSDMAEKLLQLSRLDAGFARTEVEVDLLPVVHLVADEFKRHHNITLNIKDGTTLAAFIHEDAFFVALRNLVQNAINHGDGEVVEINLAQDNVISVTNSGTIIPPEVLMTLGEAFSRGNSPASGTGLGLSIVSSIMLQVNGKLILNSPASALADGFEAVLKLPSN